MAHANPSDAHLQQLLTDATTIAIVGASSSPDKASHGIMQKLQSVSYRVIPVNPRETEILGERSFPSLIDVPERIDIVDVFRRAEDTPGIADDAVTIGAKALWLQTGIVSEDAAARARAGELTVVMDACIGTTHSLKGSKENQDEVGADPCVRRADPPTELRAGTQVGPYESLEMAVSSCVTSRSS